MDNAKVQDDVLCFKGDCWVLDLFIHLGCARLKLICSSGPVITFAQAEDILDFLTQKLLQMC